MGENGMIPFPFLQETGILSYLWRSVCGILEVGEVRSSKSMWLGMSVIVINLMSPALLKLRFLGLMILLCINYGIVLILNGMV